LLFGPFGPGGFRRKGLLLFRERQDRGLLRRLRQGNAAGCTLDCGVLVQSAAAWTGFHVLSPLIKIWKNAQIFFLFIIQNFTTTVNPKVDHKGGKFPGGFSYESFKICRYYPSQNW